jgi:KTSC domain-containing protein
MVDWYPVADSSRIVVEAYLAESQIILVRFPNGEMWAYEGCPPDVWQAFTAPGQSRGRYIARVLDCKRNHRWIG